MTCPHCGVTFKTEDCATRPGKRPADGDAGVCVTCGGWWTMHRGEYFKYTPSREELFLVARYAMMHARKAGYN